MSLLLRAAGLSPADLALVDVPKLRADLAERGPVSAVVRALARVAFVALRLLWKIAAPYVMLRQVIALFVLQVGHEGVLPLAKWSLRQLGVRNPESAKARKLREDMEAAKSYEEWREAARALEAMLRPRDAHDAGDSERMQRMQGKSELYGRLVGAQDVEQLQYRLRGELLRKHWGLGGTDDAMTRENPRARQALHQYMDVVCDALSLIARGARNEEDLDLQAKISALRSRTNFFSETLHSFGRSALLLSGGARLGLMHLGVVRALRDQKLLPRVISGASAGSIVAAMLGAWRDDELDEHLFNPANINLRFFALIGEDERAGKSVEELAQESGSLVKSMLLLLPPPLPAMVQAVQQIFPVWLGEGTLLDVNVLAAAIRASCGDLTFLEAFERTGRIINITVSPSGDRDFPLLLNYLTSPRVLLWSASMASSAIPGVFGTVELMAKDMQGNIVAYYPEGLRWTDGSVENDLPMQRLSELFNVNHFVVSQVNPHARLLAPMQKGPRLAVNRGPASSLVNDALTSTESITKVVVDFCRDQVRSSVKHFAAALMIAAPIFPLFAPLRTLGRSLVPILTQKYSGDITIMPSLTLHRVINIMSNPSDDDYLEDLMAGERTTWPHISRIRLHVAIELILDDCRQSCRRQLARMEERLLSGGASPRAGAVPGMGTTDPRAGARKVPIPTASVLNLSELDVGAPGIPLNASSFASGAMAAAVATGTSAPRRLRAGSGLGSSILARNTSFADLNAKLKTRVLSFAEFPAEDPPLGELMFADADSPERKRSAGGSVEELD